MQLSRTLQTEFPLALQRHSIDPMSQYLPYSQCTLSGRFLRLSGLCPLRRRRSAILLNSWPIEQFCRDTLQGPPRVGSLHMPSLQLLFSWIKLLAYLNPSDRFIASVRIKQLNSKPGIYHIPRCTRSRHHWSTANPLNHRQNRIKLSPSDNLVNDE